MNDISKNQNHSKKTKKNVLTGSLDLPTFRSVNGCATNCAKRAKCCSLSHRDSNPGHSRTGGIDNSVAAVTI